MSVSYTKTTWANGTSPAINATNLNKIETGIKACADAINAIYPVGAIYMSVNSTNPGTLFGGTWEQITDRFLLGASSTYAAGSTGGVAEQKLSAAIGAGHSDPNSIAYVADDTSSYAAAHSAMYKVSGSSYTSGGSFGHSTPVTVHDSTDRNVSNMPPYLAVYIWKRTA